MVFGDILNKILLNENVEVDNVVGAMDRHSKVIINYHSDGKNNNTGTRVIEPVAYGLTKSGNPVIRAFQPYGDTTTKTPGWKMFRLDRISYWEETKYKFYDVPNTDFNDQELNVDGDNSMSVVIKTFRSTVGNNAANAVNLGPKTKEKVWATTSGDETVRLGRRNVELQKNAIKVDLENNKKANNSFNMYTDNTPTEKGPRISDISVKPNISGNAKDVDKQELEKARAQVQYDSADVDKLSDSLWSDYEHDWTQDEIDQADWDRKVMNRELWQNKDLSTSRRKYDRSHQWEKSTDSGFKNRADSGNRVLYNMDKEENNKK